MLKGRYGWDKLNTVLLILSLIPLVWVYTYCLTILLWIYILYRTFSKNILKRNEEKQAFDRLLLKLAGTSQNVYQQQDDANQKESKRQKKTYRFFTCDKCAARLRVPRGKGKVRLTCPRCGNRFEKRT